MSITWSWIVLVLAGLFEICWAVGLKYTQGFTKLWPSVFTIVTLIISMVLLSKATEALPIGTAYAVWVGIGAFGAGVLGIILFKDPTTFARLFFLGLILVSVVGLKITS